MCESICLFFCFFVFKREFQVCLQKYYFSLRSWPLEGHPILSLLTHLSLCLSKNVQGRAVLSTTWSSCCFVCSTEFLRCQTGWLLPTASTGWILRGLLSHNHLDLKPTPSFCPRIKNQQGSFCLFLSIQTLLLSSVNLLLNEVNFLLWELVEKRR